MSGQAKAEFPSAKELVSGVDKLVSLPEVCFLVNDLVNDPLAEINDIGRVISQDPDLTARLLRLVNSSFYGLPAPVDTVSRAIMVVGLTELQNLVWASSAVETFSKLPPAQANMAGFWRHAIFCGVVGRIIARERNILHPERLFVAGLLHDVGRLLIFHKLPEAAARILAREAEEPGMDPTEHERAVLGYDHGEVVGELFTEWGLPQSLIETTRWHHAPAQAEDHALDAAILHVANTMAHALELGEDETLNERCENDAWRLLELPAHKIKPILHESVLQFLETLELLLPGQSQRL